MKVVCNEYGSSIQRVMELCVESMGVVCREYGGSATLECLKVVCGLVCCEYGMSVKD